MSQGASFARSIFHLPRRHTRLLRPTIASILSRRRILSGRSRRLRLAAKMADPPHQVSQSEFKAATSALESYADGLRSDPTFRLGADPLFLLHPPGKRVHGTVLLLHGFTRVASASKQQADYFFSRGFNAVALNLAGHHASPAHWPSLTLRESAGYTAVRSALQVDATIAPLLELLNRIPIFGPKEELCAANAQLGSLMSAVAAVVRRDLDPETSETALRALALLDPKTTKQGAEKELHKYFATDLHRYESDPFSKLALLAALPGPLHVVGFSLGTAEAINLSASSNLVHKAVLLAPFLGDSQTSPQSEVAHFVNTAGALDLFSTEVPQLTGEIVDLPGRAHCAAMIAAAFLNRNAISDAMRDNTGSFSVLGADDPIVDVPQSLEYCQNKLGSRAFVYPAELGVGHGLSPEVGSRFGFSLIEEIANYFVSGEIDESNLLVEKREIGNSS